MPEMKCTLNHRRCNTVGGCAGCGWEENEIWRRMQIRREVGLTLCEDGPKRLVVGRPREMEEETEEEQKVADLVWIFKKITRWAGMEIINRVEFRDRRSGRQYR